MKTLLIQYLLFAIASYGVYRILAGIQSFRSEVWRGIEANLRKQPLKRDMMVFLAWPVTLPMTIFSFVMSYINYDYNSYDREIVKEMVKKNGKINTQIILNSLCGKIPDHVSDIVEEKKFS